MNDLISRQAAIRWVKTECNPYGKPTLDFECGKRVIEHLKNMPTIEAEPVKHGRWIMKWHTCYRVELPYCSVCNKGATFKWDYCPHCGARMDGEEK